MDEVVRKKRVLFLFAHLHKGGMQKAVSNITRSIGNDFDLYVAYFGTESPGFAYKAKEHNFDISGSKATGLLSKAANFKKRLRALKIYVAENEIDIVISFGEAASVINMLTNHLAKKYLSIRVALEESLGSGFYGRIYKILIKFLYPKADMIIPVSHALAEEIKYYTNGKVPIKVINNLYFSEELNQQANLALPNEYAYLSSSNYIVNVGSYCYQKGQDLLIDAFSKSDLCKQGYSLVLVGRGPDEILLKEQAMLLGIDKQVVFTGFQSNPYSFIKHAELFVLSSRYEGFPNVLVEAMIIGTPVVAFDCPTGPREILKRNLSSSLISLGSVNELTLKLKNIRALDNSLYTERGLEFDYLKVTSEWESIIK
ncbi:glycosyltransferase [Marinomonas sp.]|uniref:glycosyltransferase n=1 Tax=Marinomonas sp. TaxID=1904862 RepID=UPI003A94E8E7